VRRAGAAAVLVLAVALPATVRAATIKPKGAAFTIDLPAGWKPTQPERGWRFKAVAPGFAAWVFVSARDDTVDFNSFAASFVAFERQQTRTLGSRVTFRARHTTIASEPAILVYAAGKGGTTEYLYGFVHHGIDYVLAFATTSDRAVTEKSTFDRVAGTVRFLNP
jgi:hypothetical protein